MNILMIAPQPFFEPRGTPISVYQRLKAVSKLGHNVDLVVYHLGKDLKIPGVNIIRTPKVSFVKEIKIGPSFIKPFLDILLFIKCVTLMRKKKYDLIHSHEEAAFFSIILAGFFKVPHLYDMHSELAGQIRNSKYRKIPFLFSFFSILERFVLKSCKAVITIGADLEEHVKKVNPQVKMTRIDNLPLNCFDEFVNPDLLNKLNKLRNNGNKLIIYTGTFEPYQGLEMFIESAGIIKSRYSDVLFIMVGGKNNQVEKLKALARSMDLEDSFKFVGSVPPEEALAYLEIADILISPRIQGMSVPLKIYSYLQAGKPFVATRIYAHTQVLNDESTLLVEPTKEAFAEGIIEILGDNNLRNRLSSKARLYAEENFNFIDYTRKVESIYQVIENPEDGMRYRENVIKV
jgi:glycosyltransferase involved in cell wall biosynthesis